VAVADVFQALVQDRPYRKPLDLTEIKSIMDDMVSNSKLDSVVVSVLQEHQQQCLTLAQGK
jgi:HD-GYP domain-containing protein (c-di-GMP phosphodiesterase class II)